MEKAIQWDDLIAFLNNFKIKTEIIDKDKYGFSRTISFKVYETEYKIIWFTNHSTLTIGAGDRPACIPFKYIYYDNTYPLVGGNKSIGFAYIKLEPNILKTYPFEVFRIPSDLNNFK